MPVLDFREVLQRVAARRLPPRHRYLTPPRVLMKLDVEGEELRVLPHILAPPERTLCHSVDAMSIEYHSHVSRSFAANRPHEVLLDRWLVAESKDPACRFKRLFHVDDESFVHDGVPLP